MSLLPLDPPSPEEPASRTICRGLSQDSSVRCAYADYHATVTVDAVRPLLLGADRLACGGCLHLVRRHHLSILAPLSVPVPAGGLSLPAAVPRSCPLVHRGDGVPWGNS